METTIVILLLALIVMVIVATFVFVRKQPAGQLPDNQNPIVIGLQKDLEHARKELADAVQRSVDSIAETKCEMEKQLREAKEDAEKRIDQIKEEHKQQLASVQEKHAEDINAVKKEQKEQYDRLLAEQQTAHETALKSQQEMFAKSIDEMKASVKNTTEDVLKKRQEEFAQTSKDNISQILDPLQKELKEMRQSVSDSKEKQIELNTAVRTKIDELMQQTERTSQSADELTMALKNSHKTQGDWGETKLIDLLRTYGFQEGRQILSQEYIKDEYGRLIMDDKGGTKRTDVILRLDDKRVIVIDSKTSLEAYLDYIEAYNNKDEAAMQKAIEANLNNIKNQIHLLSKANYSALVVEPYQTIDYTIMYVPVAGALQLAMANDNGLWHNAMEKEHILLCDDRMLETIIRTIEITWTRIDQVNNQQKIIDAAERIIDRVELLAEHFVNAEEAVSKAQKEISDCRKQLTNGGSSILTAAGDLRKLGVKAALTPARSKRRKKIAGLLEETGEIADYEDVSDSEIIAE